jgi:N-carbamoyl-L-amino-acid hydrolase
MPSIDAGRTIADLRRLAAFGAYKTGVHRPTYSPQDVAARNWIAERMGEAGLAPVIDGIGNVIGRSPVDGPRLLIGSHSESQNHAGWLDGALGVVYGLEVARAVQEDPACAGLAIDVVSFADEESHYGSFVGSRSLCGLLDDAEIDRLVNRTDGTPLRTALEGAGFAGRQREQIAPDRYKGFLEAHIEQGDYLESSKLRLGIVTSIVAIWQYRIHFDGEQNHAGTTRMAVRKDAGLALVRLAAAIDRRFPEVAGERTVWTTGRITLEPGAPSIIPGRAEMLLQFRDADPDRLTLLERTLEQLVEAADATGPCRCRLEVMSRSEPKVMDPRFQDALEAAAERHAPGAGVRMPSAAGHDAQVLARRVPAGMLFVPSIGGISHHWREDTREEDIVLGCQVMATAAVTILRSGAVSPMRTSLQ